VRCKFTNIVRRWKRLKGWEILLNVFRGVWEGYNRIKTSVIASSLGRQSHRQVVIIISGPVSMTADHNLLCVHREEEAGNCPLSPSSKGELLYSVTVTSEAIKCFIIGCDGLYWVPLRDDEGLIRCTVCQKVWTCFARFILQEWIGMGFYDFCPENGGRKYLRNLGTPLPNYTAF
jgi:hypothetical protein